MRGHKCLGEYMKWNTGEGSTDGRSDQNSARRGDLARDVAKDQMGISSNADADLSQAYTRIKAQRMAWDNRCWGCLVRYRLGGVLSQLIGLRDFDQRQRCALHTSRSWPDTHPIAHIQRRHRVQAAA
jgi:hypothetical protein